MFNTPEIHDIFTRYSRLRDQAESLFARVQNDFPECVRCERGCSDCCHALFDLSLIEAIALNQAFARMPYGPERSDILLRASDIDRQITRLKKQLYQESKAGASPEAIMDEVARTRIPCPLLNAEQNCQLYGDRPITCRLYGVPTAIGGKGHVCGKAAFTPGKPYPTIALDRIQDSLADLSAELASALESRFTELHTVYVPVSTALVTKYDKKWLGIGAAAAEDL